MKVEESKLRQYLLKNLSDEETETIDLRIFDDEEFESLLTFAEEDLIEDYVDDALSTSERELFRQNFLTSPRRREHLAFLTRLKAEAAKTALAEITQKVEQTGQTEKPLSFSEKLAKFFRPSLPQIAASASIAIIFVLFAWWLIGSDGRTGEIAVLNKKDLSNLSAYQKSSNLTLTTDVLRGGNNAGKTLDRDLLTENVLVRMDLRESVDSVSRLEIYRGENLLETLENVPVYRTQSGAEIRLLLPASKLEKGAYRIEFQIENRKTIYNFAVQ